MAYRNNNAEGSSSGTLLALGQSGSGDAFDDVAYASGTARAFYTSDNSIHGSQSYRITTAVTSDTAIISFQGANDPSAAIRFYICMVGRPSAAVQIAALRSTSAGIGAILTTGTYRLQLQDIVGTNLYSTTNPLASGIWYRVELAITVDTSTTGSASFSYYLGDSTTPVESVFTSSAINFGTINVDTARFGKLTTSAATTNFYWDDMAFTDGLATFIGPFSPTAAMPWTGAP